MRKALLALMVLMLPVTASAAEGVIQLKSDHSVAATADKLVNALTGKGLTVFAEIDHAAGAEEAEMTLRPTELIVFGNPKVGTPLMQCAQTTAIDLPQKALVWEDEDGQVWLGYNDPAYLKERHGLEGCDEALEKVATALDNFARMATQ